MPKLVLPAGLLAGMHGFFAEKIVHQYGRSLLPVLLKKYLYQMEQMTRKNVRRKPAFFDIDSAIV